MTQAKFIDLLSQQERLFKNVQQAITKVLKHGKYILGPEVLELEKSLEEFCGAKYAITCGNGTDALKLFLMYKNVNHQSAVFVPSFTFAATAEVVKHLGAIPIFVDVLPDTFNIDVDSLKRGMHVAQKLGLTLSGVIAVDLFGQPADYDSIVEIVYNNNMWLLCDAAQSFGAVYKGKKVGNIGDATSTSFYPSKPLGCYGDGGCIFTNKEETAEALRSLRVNGRGQKPYEHTKVGINSRLDTIQAAILLEKLKLFPDEITKRQLIADQYTKYLSEIVKVPRIAEGTIPNWALYTIILQENQDRDVIQSKLKLQNIPTAVYYPKPLHMQLAYKGAIASDQLKNSEYLAKKVLSLPMHPYLKFTDDYIEKIISILKNAR